ncbi:hypothetical protein [Staphylococcus delphini]|uniref:hypothetical protein n=1 Tax=Staphylococcus delphini TaxID=53344 RepID=UPI0021D3877E|nr:hypothetical protein [Staphylococcus delphini]UXS43786.1 hypothetical protein MUA39_10535 [Staphylococcus delphini]UXV46320.1 hypothetical protein MUA63_13640 [Staphylococcus delphini]
MKKFLGFIVIAIFILSACGKDYDVKDATKGFKDDGLSVKEEREMTRHDYGMAPMKAKEGVIFGVEKGYDDQYMNGRLMKFDNKDDLEQTKKYYDEVGKESALLYSHTYSKDDFLLQMNGEIDDKTFEKYKKSMENTLK